MHRSRLGSLVIDCRTDDELERYAAFWSQALGYEIAVQSEENPEKYVELSGPDRELTIILQKVGHESRVHLDIETDDKAAEVARLEKLGARRVADFPRWVVLEAPSGHRFCVVKPQRPDFEAHANVWDD
jgi:hypothetical protein